MPGQTGFWFLVKTQVSIDYVNSLFVGLPDFVWYNLPKRGIIYQKTTKIPPDHNIPISHVDKLYRIAIKYISKYSSPGPSKTYQNWDFWHENMYVPSGNLDNLRKN
jgi:hypothetical protein